MAADCIDLASPESSNLPREETDALARTTPQWPIMHAVLDGHHRDEMMARHNPINPGGLCRQIGEAGPRALRIKAAHWPTGTGSDLCERDSTERIFCNTVAREQSIVTLDLEGVLVPDI